MYHKGGLHKGYINYSPEGGFQFVVRWNARYGKVNFTVPLTNFKQHLTTLLGDDILSPCPPSLCKSLDPSNPDRQVWLDSYNEEKRGLIYHEVYEKISNSHYLALRRAGNIPKATPSMCVLVMENEKCSKPLRAKSRIVVLGKLEDRLYQKSQRYVPVLKYISLRLLTAKSEGDKLILQQVYCKNAFCNNTLPDDELTVIRPPIGDLYFQDDGYWLLKIFLAYVDTPIIGKT